MFLGMAAMRHHGDAVFRGWAQSVSPLSVLHVGSEVYMWSHLPCLQDSG